MANLFTPLKEKQINRVISIPVEKITANAAQPRKYFDEQELLSLSMSIKNSGLLQPITVRKVDNDRFELISGERRLRACKLCKMETIPSIVISADEQQSAVFAIVENLQRSDLNFFEQASGILNLMEQWGVTQEQAAVKLGMAQSTIANKIRLLKIEEKLQGQIIENHLSERHARCLLKLPEPKRGQALKRIIKNKLNVSQSEKLVQDMLAEKAVKSKSRALLVVKDVRLFLNSFTRAVETMNLSGIEARTECRENEEFLEYTVKIPKHKAYTRHLA